MKIIELKKHAKTICLSLAGGILLFWILIFTGIFDLDNTGWLFCPPIVVIVLTIAGFSLGKQEHKTERSTTSQNNFQEKLVRAKELLDTGCITETEYKAIVDSIIEKI